MRWPGWRDDAGLFQEMADLCICASRQEGLGSVILEAWARDRAVLSTRAQGPVDIITHGENGWLTPLDDPAALEKTGQGLFRAQAQPVEGGATVRHQMIERSNVDLLQQMVAMMSSQRAYQSAAQMSKLYDQVLSKITTEVGRL